MAIDRKLSPEEEKAVAEFLRRRKLGPAGRAFDGAPRVKSVADLGGPGNPGLMGPVEEPPVEPEELGLPGAGYSEGMGPGPKRTPEERAQIDALTRKSSRTPAAPPLDEEEDLPAGSGARAGLPLGSTRYAQDSETDPSKAGRGATAALAIDEESEGGTPVRPKGNKAVRPKGNKANPLGDAFKKNELALAFERAGKAPDEESALADDGQPVDEFKGGRADERPDPGPPPADPRKSTPVPSELETRNTGAPEDKRAMYAALQGVTENAWRMIGQDAPKGGYYNQKIKEGDEQQKSWESEKDRRAKQVEMSLRQKFEGDQNDLNRGVQSAHNKATEDQAAAALASTNDYRGKQLQNADENQQIRQELAALAQKGAMQRTIINVNAGKDARSDKAVADFEKNSPDEGEMNALARIQTRIKDPREPEGWRAGKFFDTFKEVPLVGGIASSMGNEARRGTEAEGLLQDALTGIQAYGYRVSGATMTDDERRQVETRMGAAAGQSWGAFRRAFQNEINTVDERQARKVQAMNPQAQQKVKERGLLHPIGEQKTGYAPPLGQSNKHNIAPELEAWLMQKYGKVPEDFEKKKGIYIQKAMQDSAVRDAVRKSEGID